MGGLSFLLKRIVISPQRFLEGIRMPTRDTVRSESSVPCLVGHRMCWSHTTQTVGLGSEMLWVGSWSTTHTGPHPRASGGWRVFEKALGDTPRPSASGEPLS